MNGVSRREVNLRVLQRRTQPPLPVLITLFQALTKSKSMDWIVQKATELGAHRIVPITAARSVVHIEPGDTAPRIEKWMASAVEGQKLRPLTSQPRRHVNFVGVGGEMQQRPALEGK